MRRLHILPILLTLFVCTNIAFAIGYFYLTGTTRLTVITPYVTFYQWSDSAKSKTISLDVSITPDDWTVIQNATWGIINDKDGLQECAFFVDSISTPTNRPANFTVQIVNATHVKATWTTTLWTDLGVDYAVPFTMNAHEIATMKIWVLGSATPVDCDVIFKVQVPSEGY